MTVFTNLWAVAEKVREVAVDLGSAYFLIVLRLVVHDKVHNEYHSCLSEDYAIKMFEKDNI